MSLGIINEELQNKMRNKNFIPANPIFRVMIDYELVDMSYSANFQYISGSPRRVLLARLQGNSEENALTTYEQKLAIILCGIYGNLKIIAGNSSKLESYFLNKDLPHFQHSRVDKNVRHVATNEALIITKNAFFTKGLSSKSYIHNSREAIIGIVFMHNFACLFNDTLHHFKFNDDSIVNNEEKLRDNASYLLRLILKNTGRVLYSTGYVWGLNPDFLSYNEKNEKSINYMNIRYRLLEIHKGTTISHRIRQINKDRYQDNKEKREKKRKMAEEEEEEEEDTEEEEEEEEEMEQRM